MSYRHPVANDFKSDCWGPGESWWVNKALARFPSCPLGTHWAELGQESPSTAVCTIILWGFYLSGFAACSILPAGMAGLLQGGKGTGLLEAAGCVHLGVPRIVEQPSTATEAISQIWDLPASPVSAVTLLTHVLTSPALGWMLAGELHQKPTHGAPWNGKSGMCWLLLLDNYTRVWPGASQSFVVSMSCSHPWQQVPFSAEDLWEPWLVQISDVSWGPQQAARSSRVHWWKLNALFWMLCFPLGCRARGSQCNIGTT